MAPPKESTSSNSVVKSKSSYGAAASAAPLHQIITRSQSQMATTKTPYSHAVVAGSTTGPIQPTNKASTSLQTTQAKPLQTAQGSKLKSQYYELRFFLHCRLAWILFWEYQIYDYQINDWIAPVLCRSFNIKWWDNCDVSKCERTALIKSLTGLQPVPTIQSSSKSSVKSEKEALRARLAELGSDSDNEDNKGSSDGAYSLKSMQRSVPAHELCYGQDPYEVDPDFVPDSLTASSSSKFKEVTSRRSRRAAHTKSSSTK